MEQEKTLRQKQIEEAIVRMRMLKLMPNVIQDFKKEGRVYYSERQNKFFNAVLYWLDNNEEWLKTVEDFEKRNKALVYHCQLTHLECGDVLSLLYVSSYEEEWSQERDDIKEGRTIAHCINLDDDLFSETGYIGIKPSMGGVLRTA